MAEYLFRSRHAAGKIRGAPRIMDLIDIDSYKWRQYADQAPFWKAWVYRMEATHCQHMSSASHVRSIVC